LNTVGTVILDFCGFANLQDANTGIRPTPILGEGDKHSGEVDFSRLDVPFNSYIEMVKTLAWRKI